MTIMIGIDPHKATHTAVAVDRDENVLEEFTVRASSVQARRLRSWAERFDQAQWAVESANGLGYLLAQQLVACGERVFDVPPVLASRVRVLGSGRSQKNDPNDARAVAIVAWHCCVGGDPECGEAHAMRRRRSCPPVDLGGFAFSGYRFPPEVIVLAVRWYLRFGLSYRDLEELLAERGIEVDHVTLFRWVQTFTPLLVDAARPCRHAVGGRWFVDETYVKVAGVWRYVYRAVDEPGQVIDVYVSARRDIAAARRFFTTALTAHGTPGEVVTDLAQALETAVEELMPDAFHNTDQYANNRVECDHGRLKARLRPMRGLKTDRTAQVVIAGHAFRQNVRRGHYELGVEADPRLRVQEACNELREAL